MTTRASQPSLPQTWSASASSLARMKPGRLRVKAGNTRMNIVTDITSPGFGQEHPELHHYTTFEGLKGICTSQTLWAMQFDQLNDGTEFRVLKQPLSCALEERFFSLLKERQRESLRVRRAIERGGGVLFVARDQASRFASALYESSFRTPSERSAYVTSFCTHAEDDYARENGLLSQWRAYGKDGGFCIVFDASGIVELLQKEFECHHWISLRLDQVVYNTANFSIEASFGSLLDEAEDVFLALIGHDDPSPTALAHFMRAASLLKHQGFREENEVRIVAFPATPLDNEVLRARYGYVPLKTKDVCSIDTARGKRSYVPLFKGLGLQLPIKRVIIGPSKRQAEARAKAEVLLGSSINVEQSQTPFVE